MQEIGKVKKMMQNPVDESLIVFTGKSSLPDQNQPLPIRLHQRTKELRGQGNSMFFNKLQ
jgi:hypothetical protein